MEGSLQSQCSGGSLIQIWHLHHLRAGRKVCHIIYRDHKKILNLDHKYHWELRFYIIYIRQFRRSFFWCFFSPSMRNDPSSAFDLPILFSLVALERHSGAWLLRCLWVGWGKEGWIDRWKLHTWIFLLCVKFVPFYPPKKNQPKGRHYIFGRSRNWSRFFFSMFTPMYWQQFAWKLQLLVSFLEDVSGKHDVLKWCQNGPLISYLLRLYRSNYSYDVLCWLVCVIVSSLCLVLCTMCLWCIIAKRCFSWCMMIIYDVWPLLCYRFDFVCLSVIVSSLIS